MSSFSYRLSQGQTLISVEDYRRRARRRLPRMVWNYVDGGADNLVTLHDNAESFQRLRFNPTVLSGVAKPDTRCTVAGVELRAPILLAPTGFSGLSHWTGDIASATAAEEWGTRYVLSTMSSWSIEEVFGRTTERHFFQLYPRTSALTDELMKRAAAQGTKVLFVTVDTPVLGNREGERRAGMSRPPTLTPGTVLDMQRHPAWLCNLLVHRRIAGRNYVDQGGLRSALESVDVQYRSFAQASLSWEDVCWIRERWDGKVYLKGILNPADAERAVGYGFDGIVVSNHGGRQLDGAPASIDALPSVAETVAGRIEVLLDGGVRRGSDVLKAMALGADAVLIGRPYLYGLAARGKRGVTAVLDILLDEFTRTLTLAGVSDLKEVSRSLIR